MEKGAALEEIAKGRLSRLLAYDKSFNCTDATGRDSALFHKAVSRNSAPRWRSPAVILDVDDAGMTAKFQGSLVLRVEESGCGGCGGRGLQFCFGERGNPERQAIGGVGQDAAAAWSGRGI